MIEPARWPWYFYLALIIGCTLWILTFYHVGAVIWWYLSGGR